MSLVDDITHHELGGIAHLTTRPCMALHQNAFCAQYETPEPDKLW